MWIELPDELVLSLINFFNIIIFITFFQIKENKQAI